MSDNGDHRLSTSAVAKALHLPLQQLFITLRDYGWIRKAEDGWLLTAKGEFEGGEYVHSRRYGRYIVWPATIVDHQLLRGLEENRHWSGLQLARQYGIGVREVMRLLGEAGLLQRGFNGWRLTAAGERLGGVAVEHDGVTDILWPAAALESPLFAEQLGRGRQFYLEGRQLCLADHRDEMASADDEQAPRQGELLAPPADGWQGLDGHACGSCGEWAICNWLYLAGVAHACRRALPADAPGSADFYLPRYHLFIEFSGDEREPGLLRTLLTRLDIYRERHLPHLEVRPEHLPHLDDFLTRELTRLGVELL